MTRGCRLSEPAVFHDRIRFIVLDPDHVRAASLVNRHVEQCPVSRESRYLRGRQAIRSITANQVVGPLRAAHFEPPVFATFFGSRLIYDAQQAVRTNIGMHR